MFFVKNVKIIKRGIRLAGDPPSLFYPCFYCQLPSFTSHRHLNTVPHTPCTAVPFPVPILDLQRPVCRIMYFSVYQLVHLLRSFDNYFLAKKNLILLDFFSFEKLFSGETEWYQPIVLIWGYFAFS